MAKMLRQWGRQSGWQTVHADSEDAVQGRCIGRPRSRPAARGPSKDADDYVFVRRTGRRRSRPAASAPSRNAVQEGDGPGRWRRRRTVMRWGQGKKIGVHGEGNLWARSVSWDRGAQSIPGIVGVISFSYAFVERALGCNAGCIFFAWCGMSTSPSM
jgi:hypothetical protein